MSEFNFKSQPYTTIEQSQRLIALGIKVGTADCCHWYCISCVDEPIEWENIPAWSLHRLIEMATTENIQISFYKNQVKVWGRICREEFEASYYDKPNVFDNFICGIEWLIKEGYFNKEYLV